jgi:hypothetical protein
MAYDESLAARVRRALRDRPDLVERRMMGGLCFMIGGSMCCGVKGSDLMVRVGRDAYREMLTRPHVRPMEIGGRQPGGFVCVAPPGYRSAAQLAAWVRRGVDFAATLPPRAQR